MLVDGENSGEVFIVPQDGYMGSTFKQLWISSSMYEPYVLAFIQFYKETLRNSKKGAAIPHLNKELFYGLIIGIPSLQEQRRIVQKIEQLTQLLKQFFYLSNNALLLFLSRQWKQFVFQVTHNNTLLISSSLKRCFIYEIRRL